MERDDELEELRREVAHLRNELRVAERSNRQLRRTAESYEQIADRGRLLAQRAREDLRTTIDELRRLTHELEGAKADAERSSAARTRFLATISHELRTPLSGLMATAELLLGTRLDPNQEELVGLLHRSARSLCDLVGDILDFARLDEGRLALEHAAFNLHDCVHDVTTLFAASCRARGVELRATLDPSVPRHVMGDPLRVRQVLLNLVDNACKFTARGHVTISVGAASGGVRFRVQDSGVGIGPEDLNRLFEPFTQVDDSTSRRYGGSGLGLAICKRLVELMGGALGADSAPGVGSAFHFEIPLRPMPRISVDPVATRTPAAPKAREWSARVLVVDDNCINLTVAARMLDHLGHSAEVVSDGRAALARIARGGLDLVLMDLSMPGLDGYACALALRSGDPPGSTIPIVALSAHTSPSDIQRALACGMNAHLGKPFRMDDLAGVVDRWARALTNA
ncbi:MAG TPA: ATP-binding protein [Myxococcota bacterium]|nr:ATP-binding protein [Myxococcota bacterium]